MSGSDLPVLSAEVLREVCARTMYSIDGLWFLAVEEEFGFKAAFELNQRVWARCSFLHARRLLRNLNLDGKAPLEALAALIFADPITVIRYPRITTLTDTRLVFRTFDCPPQVARLRDGRGVFDGKPGCTRLFQAYATLVDPRIRATCVSCAPNPEKPEYWCEWEFKLSEEKNSDD